MNKEKGYTLPDGTRLTLMPCEAKRGTVKYYIIDSNRSIFCMLTTYEIYKWSPRLRKWVITLTADEAIREVLSILGLSIYIYNSYSVAKEKLEDIHFVALNLLQCKN